MKKSIIVFVIVVIVLAATLFWMLSSSGNFKTTDLISLGVIILLVAFAVFIGIKRIGSARRGEPAEDELSKKVTQKTASLSYYISLYLWLIIGYFSERLDYETHTLIGAGIFGMALTFALCWLIIKFGGIKNE
jgi:peptidoglycan/LPS O-acetylase OafA/YrhL